MKHTALNGDLDLIYHLSACYLDTNTHLRHFHQCAGTPKKLGVVKFIRDLISHQYNWKGYLRS